ncbi:uroporphyrinogen-III synthase [Gemmobacter serpentinus]|uniref:uroporphyrinogen-III synthase n=1 Tax=Gemmobacter serpentinus TaxID=2652247 RepID=UPI00124F15A2|nr:uroporphyrinogen-III synthase [Gemmobacter serpentinus]
MVRQSRPGPLPAQILLTRPLAEAERFADLIRASSPAPAPDILISPLLAPEFLCPSLPDRAFSALVLTSATAVEALRHLGPPRARHAFCVGPRTADAARAFGLQAISADGDAEALLDLILHHRPPPQLLHLHGEETRGDLARRLTDAGIETLSRVIYRQNAQPLSDAARYMLAGVAPVVLPVFSPRSAALLAAALQTQPARAPLHIVALSQATAVGFAGFPLDSLTIAAQPNGKDLLAALLARIA